MGLDRVKGLIRRFDVLYVAVALATRAISDIIGFRPYGYKRTTLIGALA